VEEERESVESLQSRLHSRRPSSDGRYHRLGLKVPSSVRSDKVGDAEEVEGARQCDAGDSVQ
jgi:hypothetical protein